MKWSIAFKFVVSLLGICLLPFSGGCASSGYLATHPDLDPRVRESIENNRIFSGMNTEQVIASWGEPDRQNEDENSITWDYFQMIPNDDASWELSTPSNGLVVSYGRHDSEFADRHRLHFFGETLVFIETERGRLLGGDYFFPCSSIIDCSEAPGD